MCWGEFWTIPITPSGPKGISAIKVQGVLIPSEEKQDNSTRVLCWRGISDHSSEECEHIKTKTVNEAVTFWPLAYPFPARSDPGAALFSNGHTVLGLTQSFSSELSTQSFCLLHVRVELMQRPARERMFQKCVSVSDLCVAVPEMLLWLPQSAFCFIAAPQFFL